MTVKSTKNAALVVAMVLHKNGLYAAIPNSGPHRGVLTLPCTDVHDGESVMQACERYVQEAGIIAIGLKPSGFHIDEAKDLDTYTVTLAFTPAAWELKSFDEFFWVAPELVHQEAEWWDGVLEKGGQPD